MQSTLILNSGHEPLAIVPSKRALNLLRDGKASVVDLSGKSVFTTAADEIKLPYVIALNYYVKPRRTHNGGATFSKRGILARDGFICVYCNKYATTIDHDIPKMRGGGTTYDNCVAACLSCNRKKGHKTLKQLGWTLKVTPKAPSPMVNMLLRARNHTEQFEAWSEYIYRAEPKLRPVTQ